MENDNEYQALYAALGLKKQATLSDLKTAFRTNAKRWHPDLAKNARDGDERQRRIREVNYSYDRLSRYYKKHHVLPLFDASQPDDMPLTANRWDRLRSLLPTFMIDRARNIVGSPLAVPTLLVSLFLSIAALVLMMLPVESAKRGGALAIPTTAPLPSDLTRYITFGSTTAQVLKIHGEPEQIVGNAWHYGDSIVYFGSGKVIAWATGTEHPLRTDPAFPHSFGLTGSGVEPTAETDPEQTDSTEL